MIEKNPTEILKTNIIRNDVNSMNDSDEVRVQTGWFYLGFKFITET
jgi:hypothetical protein